MKCLKTKLSSILHEADPMVEWFSSKFFFCHAPLRLIIGPIVCPSCNLAEFKSEELIFEPRASCLLLVSALPRGRCEYERPFFHSVTLNSADLSGVSFGETNQVTLCKRLLASVRGGENFVVRMINAKTTARHGQIISYRQVAL